MKLFILILNRHPKEQYIVDQTNIRIVEEQLMAKEDLNFTKRNPNDINKLSIMGVKNSYITHWEIQEGEETDDERPERSEVH